MNVKVLGAGCEKYKKLYAETEKAIAQVGQPIELEKVAEIAAWLQGPQGSNANRG